MNIKKNLLIFVITNIGVINCAQAAIYNPANNHYYQLVEGDWFQAKTQAEQLGGYLVAIGSQNEQTWLLNNFGNHALYWIGLTDETNEGNFVWTNGEQLTYTNWYSSSNEPNNASYVIGGEDYVVMNWQSETGEWNDLGSGWLDWGYPSAWYDVKYGIAEINPSQVPLPGSTWLFVSSLLALVGVGRKRA